jgi:hypothetical protein
MALHIQRSIFHRAIEIGGWGLPHVWACPQEVQENAVHQIFGCACVCDKSACEEQQRGAVPVVKLPHVDCAKLLLWQAGVPSSRLLCG